MWRFMAVEFKTYNLKHTTNFKSSVETTQTSYNKELIEQITVHTLKSNL